MFRNITNAEVYHKMAVSLVRKGIREERDAGKEVDITVTRSPPQMKSDHHLSYPHKWSIILQCKWSWYPKQTGYDSVFKMADEDASLEELIEQAQALLEQEKPRKRKAGESEFEFYRDSVSRHRINKHKYRPRSGKPSEFSQSATSSSFEGLRRLAFYTGRL